MGDQVIHNEDSQYCHFQWNPNWNDEQMLSGGYVREHALWMDTVMGLMVIDLDEAGSVEAFCKRLRGAADQAESIKKRYDTEGYVPVAMEAWYGYEDEGEENVIDTSVCQEGRTSYGN